jgi:hypothetical protein
MLTRAGSLPASHANASGSTEYAPSVWRSICCVPTLIEHGLSSALTFSRSLA